ncbi:hypothetical protein GW750_04620 [bacterium]|nr:hypothetical protein [bacterium]
MLKKSPAQIAIELAPALESDEYFSSFEAVGPYINAYMKPTMLAKDVLHLVFEQADMYGS